MSGRRSRDKGARTERAIVRLLQGEGIAATKISGMYKPGADSVEEKCSATGFDATAFTSKWGEQAHAFGWTARELFGLHPVPERPAANYSRLSRLDDIALIWLLRGRPVIALTAAEAVMRCHSGATVTHRKLNKPALGPIGDSLDDVRVA
jgi:hypothetical protein